jgi:hypothetical protein
MTALVSIAALAAARGRAWPVPGADLLPHLAPGDAVAVLAPGFPPTEAPVILATVLDTLPWLGVARVRTAGGDQLHVGAHFVVAKTLTPTVGPAVPTHQPPPEAA